MELLQVEEVLMLTLMMMLAMNLVMVDSIFDLTFAA